MYNYCKTCRHDDGDIGFCDKCYYNHILEEKGIPPTEYEAKPKPQTNADKLRAMSDEELANMFENWIQDCGCNNVPCSEPCKRDREREITDWRDALEHKSCYDCWLDWLRQEARDA